MHRFPFLFVLPAAAALALSGCDASNRTGAGTPTPEMSDILSERVAMNAKERSSVSLQEARDVPSLVEAGHAIYNVQGLPSPGIEVSQFSQPAASGAAGSIGATLYRPALAKNTPIIVYFPGGTWATRRDADADETARQLSIRTGWVVVTLRPRLAPEAQFPAIHDDALAAYQWARGQMRSWGADPTRVVLAGEGPGANLALSTALMARDRNVPLPDGLLLISPWAGTATNTPSMSTYGSMPPLTRATVRWAQNQYAPDNLADPRIDLVARRDLAGMPATTVVVAELDPSRSEAETLAANLQQAGTRVDLRQYGGVTHDFFGLGAYVPRAAEAEQDVAAALKARYDRPMAAAPARPASRSRARR